MDRPLQSFTISYSSQPLVPIVISFILGIITASYNWLTDEPSFSFLITTMLLLIIGIMRRWRYNFMLIFAIFFFLGVIFSSQKINQRLTQNHIREIIASKTAYEKDDFPGMRVEGIVYDAPERFPDRTRLSVDAEKVFTKDKTIHVTGKILITVGSPSVKVKYGDRIRFIAKPRIPRNFGNPGEYDYAGSLAREDIYITGYVENERWIAALADEQKRSLASAIEQIRDRLRDFVDSSGVKNAAVIKALLLGEKGEISKSIKDSFSATGTAHILAISGLHIGIIAFVAYWIAFQLFKLSERLMLAFNIKKLAAVSSIIPVLIYGAIAGFSVSTQRAVIMVLIFIIAVLMDREKGLYNTLAAAAFVILIISPPAIYDISFQLSFISVLAIIYLAPKFQKFWKDKPETAIAKLSPPHPAWKLLKDYLLNPLAVSVAASIGTAPFIAYHFHRVSLIGILANLIAVPFMGFITVPLGLISGFISFFNQSIAHIVLKLSDIILKISLWIVDLFASLPYSSVFTTTPTIPEIILFYLLIICIAEFKRRKFFSYALPLVIFLLIADYSFWYYRLNYNSNFKVTFISVGQGDSALVEFPFGRRMLIDGGGFYDEDFDVGERIIAPFLWKNKIKRIDYIILSHPQADHMKGLKFVAERFRAKEFRWNGEAGNNWTYTELMQALDKNNIKKFIANSSTPPLNINGIHVSFLNPPQDGHLDVNNDSLVVKLEYKDVSFLFTGDIGAAGESALLNQDKDIGATIVKVPHHGSRTSSTIDFLNKVQPELAVASVGYMNPFGFPHPEIAQRYKDLNISLLRTDIMGAITIETDGKEKRITSYH